MAKPLDTIAAEAAIQTKYIDTLHEVYASRGQGTQPAVLHSAEPDGFRRFAAGIGLSGEIGVDDAHNERTRQLDIYLKTARAEEAVVAGRAAKRMVDEGYVFSVMIVPEPEVRLPYETSDELSFLERRTDPVDTDAIWFVYDQTHK